MAYLKSQNFVQSLLPHVADAARTFAEKQGTPPTMAILLVGDNPASHTYVRHKQKFAEKVGCVATLHHLPETATDADIEATLKNVVANTGIHGIILQLPLPQGSDATPFLNMIPAEKDIDGLGAAQRNMLVEKHPSALLPATPLGVMRWLNALNCPVFGKQVCVVGRSHLVGAPLALLLAQHGAVVHSFSQESPIQPDVMKGADIICTAAGCPNLIQPNWVKAGALVVDIGLSQTAAGKLTGDADKDIQHHANLTAAPGGVGRLTVLSLFTNLIDAAYMQGGLERPTYRTSS